MNTRVLIRQLKALVRPASPHARASIFALAIAGTAFCAGARADLPAAALQFPLRNPAVASVVAGARSAAELRQQAAWLDQPIPEALWRALDEVRAEIAL